MSLDCSRGDADGDETESVGNFRTDRPSGQRSDTPRSGSWLGRDAEAWEGGHSGRAERFLPPPSMLIARRFPQQEHLRGMPPTPAGGVTTAAPPVRVFANILSTAARDIHSRRDPSPAACRMHCRRLLPSRGAGSSAPGLGHFPAARLRAPQPRSPSESSRLRRIICRGRVPVAMLPPVDAGPPPGMCAAAGVDDGHLGASS